MASVFGQHDASWLAFYRYFHDVLELREQTQRLDGLCELAQSAGWAIPCRDVCFVAERHTTLRRDERGRLHCEDGPAVAYPDGWTTHAIHGVRVPAWIIETPSEITVEKIDSERNAEIRRVMIERFGVQKYISAGDVIDHDERFGTLYRKRRHDDSDMLMVEVINNTAERDNSFKHYFLRVHPDCRPMPTGSRKELGSPQPLTALNAVASTWGLTGKEFLSRLDATERAGIQARS